LDAPKRIVVPRNIFLYFPGLDTDLKVCQKSQELIFYQNILFSPRKWCIQYWPPSKKLRATFPSSTRCRTFFNVQFFLSDIWIKRRCNMRSLVSRLSLLLVAGILVLEFFTFPAEAHSSGAGSSASKNVDKNVLAMKPRQQSPGRRGKQENRMSARFRVPDFIFQIFQSPQKICGLTRCYTF
jgi:hypothetical protein